MSAFTDGMNAALAAPLIRDHVKQRSQAGRTLSYVEGWVAIAEANRIFGFDGWTRETVEIRVVAERERKIGPQGKQRDGWGVSYVAKVRVVCRGVVREGVGSGHGIDVDLGLAHESAIKEAETDAMKRALMTFGNPFGLALYDKDQTNVADAAPEPSSDELYMTHARAKIAGFKDRAALASWWGEEKENRERMLTVDQRAALMKETTARRDELAGDNREAS